MKKVVKGHLRYLVFATLFTVAAGFGGTYVQFIKGSLLDSALAGTGSMTLHLSIMLFCVIALEIAAYYGYDYFRGRFSVANIKTMRALYFKRLLKRSPVEVMATQRGEFIAEYTDQIDQVNQGHLGNIPLLIDIIAKMIIVSVSLFVLDYRVALLTLFLLTIPLYLPKLIEKRLQRARNASIESFQKHLGSIVEWLSGFELIKNYSIERVIYKKFEISNGDVAEKLFKSKKITYISKLITSLLSYMSHFIVLVVTAALVLNGDFTAGDFFIAVGLIDQLSYPIIAVSAYLQEYLSTKPTARKVEELIEEKQGDENRTVILSDISDVVFDSVNFAYDDATPILNNFTLNVASGEKCLLMGQSGSGKTTSMDLLMGYYDIQQGEIRLNGVDARKIKNLNEHIAVMRQDPVLFNDTLRSNLTMYQEMNDAEPIDLLKRLNLNKFANAEGLDSIIQEGGSNLSGGERKRIALARTLLRNAPITIIDEPLANVDAETAERIENMLCEASGGIIFVITHHFSPEKRSAFIKQITL